MSSDALRRLCSICARGGSKGVPGKNTRLLAGKPLIVHSIDQARASKLFDGIAVSSDSDEILEVARRAGCDVMVKRPEGMATDTAPKCPAIRHCALAAEQQLNVTFQTLVDLAATAPLRKPEDIAGAVALLESSAGTVSVITGSEARNSPYFSLVERAADGTIFVAKTPPKPIFRRQDAPECFDMNGSIYVWRRDEFIAEPQVFYPGTRLYAMPPERSVDIDGEFDFKIAELMLAEQR